MEMDADDERVLNIVRGLIVRCTTYRRRRTAGHKDIVTMGNLAWCRGRTVAEKHGRMGDGKRMTRSVSVHEFQVKQDWEQVVYDQGFATACGYLTLDAKPASVSGADRAWKLFVACPSHGNTLRAGLVWCIEVAGHRGIGYPKKRAHELALKPFRKALEGE